MSSLLWIALLMVVFAACRWSGRLLDRHYNDRVEVAAVALVGLSVLGPIALGATSATLAGVPVKLLLALAVVGGLIMDGRARTA